MKLPDEKEGVLFIETSKVCTSPLGDQANEKKTVAGCLGSKYKNLSRCVTRHVKQEHSAWLWISLQPHLLLGSGVGGERTLSGLCFCLDNIRE